MARTQPDADLTPRKARSGAGGGEWDALRSELAVLIDQVETRLLGQAKASGERDDAVADPEPHSDEAFDRLDRHSRALHSVRRAVDRFSERGGMPLAPQAGPQAGRGIDRERGAEIAEAISKIRARQGARPAPNREDYLPGRAETGRRLDARDNTFDDGRDASRQLRDEQAADPALLRAMLGSLRDLGTRMEGFEARFSGQLADLGSNRDVADQVSQLADVVEMLAGAVGEGAPMRRMEAQIAQLAEAVAHAPATEDGAILERLEALSERLEDLSGVQAELGVGQEAAGRYADATMRFVEDSVRGIYERIDALDASHAASPGELEKLSADLSALALALDQRDALAQDSLAEKFTSLERRIDSLGASTPDGADTLRDAVATLRGVVLETIEPRFDALETRLETLAAAPGTTVEADSDIAGQLKRISQRIDETGVQIEGLLALARGAAETDETQDFAALADMVAERTRAQMPAPGAERAGLDSAAIDSLEERLSRLFAESRDPAPDPAPFEKFGQTIASVDSRLAQIETMLNDQGSSAKAARRTAPAVVDETMAIAAAPAPAYARSDSMPQSPDDEAPLRQRQPTRGAHPIPDPEAVAREARAQVAPETFKLDPETIARPEKPVSSLSAQDERGPLPPVGRADDENAADGDTLHAAVNRANFIEAARRAARSHAETTEAEPPRSLIGRALARFHSTESQTENQEDPRTRVEPSGPDPAAETVSVADEQSVRADDGEARPGFLNRNRRVLLLAAALLVATALAANLVGQRLLSGPDAAPLEPATESSAAPAAAPVEPAAPTNAGVTEVEPILPIETTPAADQPAPSPSIEAPAPASLPDTGATAPATIEASDSAERVDLAFAREGGALDTSLVEAGAIEAGEIDPVTTASIGDAATAPLVQADEMDGSSMPVAEIPDGIGPEGLRLAAEAGDRFAQFEIAAILTEGHVVEQDLGQAAAWYERSAAQGFAPAQYRLGNLYESGQGVEGDLEQARLWYLRAAEAGNRMSMHNLASLYAGGQLETQDFAAAAHWFEQAAARGLTDSQFNLGMLNARGLGVDQSFEQSYIWFSLAALAGDADAAQARDDVARSLDTAVLQELDAQIESWQPAELDMAANFAPIGTWDADFEVGEAITNSEVVLRVQELLGKLGYEVGTPDGLMGPMTREAIADFERATGMNATGSVNPRLLAVLGSQPV